MFSLVAYDFLMPRILKSVQGVQLRRYALAPGIDFFNHSCRTNAEVAFEYFRDKFVVRSRNTYDKGDQVFVSYGKKNNDTLLLYYGFVELDNLNEEYVFGEAVAKALNFPPGTLRLDRDGSVSDGTKKVISKSFKGRERETFEVLKKLCKAELAQFPTSVEEDEKLWDEPKLDERGKVAIVYRMSKKRILEAACNKLETIA